MAKGGRLLQRVMEKAVSTRYWMECIPSDFADEMREVRNLFIAGKIPGRRYTIANEIIADGKSRGIKMPSQKAVADWLTREG